MKPKRRKELPTPPEAAQQEAASAVAAAQAITPENARPRLSGEGADAALLHLIEREKLRNNESKLP